MRAGSLVFPLVAIAAAAPAWADAPPPPFTPESPDNCEPEADEPQPIERLTAPPGGLWWVVPATFEDFIGATLVSASTLEDVEGREIVTTQTDFPSSRAVRVPASAAAGDRFRLRYIDAGADTVVALDVGDAPSLSSNAAIESVATTEYRTAACSCFDDRRKLMVRVALTEGPAVIELFDSDDGGVVVAGGFIVGEEAAPVVLTLFGDTTQPLFVDATHDVRVMVKNAETLEVLADDAFEVATSGLPEVPAPEGTPRCKNGCGCTTTATQPRGAPASPFFTSAAALIAVLALRLVRRA